MSGKMSNPVFNDRLRNPIATAMGGVPNLAMQTSKSKIPSPKVHPAPPPPMWPHSTTSSRVKKLSWGDDKVINYISHAYLTVEYFGYKFYSRML